MFPSYFSPMTRKEIEQLISTKQEEKQNLDRTRKHIERLNQRLAVAKEKLDFLGKRLEVENKEYEELTKLSIKSLFYTILGNKEEQIDKEKQEYLQAALHYNEFLKSVELLEYEQKVLKEKLNGAAQLDYQVKQLTEQRAHLLMKEDTEEGKHLLFLMERIEKNQVLLRELKEAFSIAVAVLEKLNLMSVHLSKASGWGTWDLFGGGVISSALKYSSIDAAKDLVPETENLLMSFEAELRDVYNLTGKDLKEVEFSLYLDSFTKFTDIFFDNLISDWIVQRKISNTIHSLDSLRDKVLRIKMSLGREYKKLKPNLEELERQREELLRI